VPARAAVGVCGALVLAGAVPLVRDSHAWVASVDDALPGLEAVTFATEAGGANVDPGRVIPLSFVPVQAGDYLAGVASVGSPLTSIDLSTWSGRPDQQIAADEILADGVVAVDEACAAGNDPGAASVSAAPGRLVQVTGEAPARVTLRRFTDSDAATTAGVDVGAGNTVLRLPADPASARGERDYVLTTAEGVSLSSCGDS